MLTGPELGSAFARAMELKGVDHRRVAQEFGVQVPSVYGWIKTGRIHKRHLARLLTYFADCVPADHWGVTQEHADTMSSAAENVSPEPIPFRGRVPLISWTTAGQWADVQDLHHPGNGDDWISTTASVGPHAFALRVQGDSMEPKVPDGSIVIIDPDRGHHHGSIVLAKRVTDQMATLKQLWFDGGDPKLRPLNDRYPILDMPTDTRIIGVAVRVEIDL